MSLIFKAFLIHGHGSLHLLLATMVPIIKNKLASVNSSKNYRSICLSSLMLKILDWVIIVLHGDALKLHDLQFAYQPECSPSMCTWGALETIGFFSRNGSDVFCCLMDNSKAFDRVRFSILFKKILKTSLPGVFCRLLFFIYLHQFANVRWNNEFTRSFSVKNGVRQGAVLSGILYCFYMNGLFSSLEEAGHGCWVESVFCGIWGYSDDSLLLAPSLEALQSMLRICENYANEHNLLFSTDKDPSKCKTKCIAFLQKKKRRETSSLPHMILCGNPLPWVEDGLHLGHHLTNEYNGLKKDILVKRGQYIERNCELLQEFRFEHPKVRMRLNMTYNSHFTGSPLWDIFSREFQMLENSWNVSIRNTYNLPFNTHRVLIGPISELPHLRTFLVKRFLSFVQKVKNSEKGRISHILKHVINDCRSICGNNMRNILLQTNKTNVLELKPSDAF